MLHSHRLSYNKKKAKKLHGTHSQHSRSLLLYLHVQMCVRIIQKTVSVTAAAALSCRHCLGRVGLTMLPRFAPFWLMAETVPAQVPWADAL